MSLAVGLWLYETGRRYAGFDSGEARQERSELQQRLVAVEQEAARLRSVVDSSDSRLQIERTAQGQLAKQVKVLEEENARLKEELAFFESLVPGERKEDRLTIHRFKVEPNGMPGEYRYRMLVYQGTARESHEFQGSVQLVVTLQRESKNVIVTLPEGRGASDPNYKLSFRRVQRVEGLFKVDSSAQVKTVQVRVLENGSAQPRAIQSYSLS